MFCTVHVMPKVMRELGMELFSQCSPPIFVHGEILPVYYALPILRMGADIKIRVSCLKVCGRVRRKLESQSFIFSVKILRI